MKKVNVKPETLDVRCKKLDAKRIFRLTSHFFLLTFIFFSSCMPTGKISTSSSNPTPYSGSSPLTPNTSPLPASPLTPHSSPLTITILNVGQGDATLLQTPNGKTLLIDGGFDGKGESVILPFLESQNISSLNSIVTTHYDADHMAGLDEVVSVHPPTLGVFDRGNFPLDESPFYSSYLEAMAPFRKTLVAGDEIALDPSLKIRCFISNGQIWQGSLLSLDGNFSQKENSSSIGLLIEYRKFRYFSGGDLTGGGNPGGFQTLDLETELATKLGKVSAIHVNHHGSSTSSNAAFVEITHPLVALFNVGDENEYHHPAQEVLERWKNIGAELWLTEKGSGGFIAGEHVVNGNIIIESDGNSMKVNGVEYNLE